VTAVKHISGGGIPRVSLHKTAAFDTPNTMIIVDARDIFSCSKAVSKILYRNKKETYLPTRSVVS